MDAYSTLVRRLAESRDPEIISNSSIEHAAILVAEMFRKGSGHARIFSGGLNPSLYARTEVVTQMGAFLSSSDSSVQILLQDRDSGKPNTHTFLTQLRDRCGENAVEKIRFAFADEFAREQSYHFTTVGESFFRFEPDRTKHEAFASFGRTEHVTKLNDAFDLFWLTAEHVQVEPEPALA